MFSLSSAEIFPLELRLPTFLHISGDIPVIARKPSHFAPEDPVFIPADFPARVPVPHIYNDTVRIQRILSDRKGRKLHLRPLADRLIIPGHIISIYFI